MPYRSLPISAEYGHLSVSRTDIGLDSAYHSDQGCHQSGLRAATHHLHVDLPLILMNSGMHFILLDMGDSQMYQLQK